MCLYPIILKARRSHFLIVSCPRWLTWLWLMQTLMGVGWSGGCGAHTSVRLLYCSRARKLTDEVTPGRWRVQLHPRKAKLCLTFRLAQHRCRAEPLGYRPTHWSIIAFSPHSYRKWSCYLSLSKRSTLLHHSPVTASKITACISSFLHIISIVRFFLIWVIRETKWLWYPFFFYLAW